MIITIDGPSGTGKTTVAKRVAERLHYVYFDTGAMYRAFTLLTLEQNIDLKDEPSIAKLLKHFQFNIAEIAGSKRYMIGKRDVSDAIRSQVVTSHVSAVSALKQVRDALLEIQHQFGKGRNAVFEGRDLGTVVFPQAEIKVFLSAAPEVRAERRLQEWVEKYPEMAKRADRQTILEDIVRRDTYDSTREVAPLRCPQDALQIDTTQLSIDQVVDQIVHHVNTKAAR